MRLRPILAALAAAALLPTAVPAQDAGARADTGLRLQTKRTRHVVPPEPRDDAAVRDAERAADLLATERIVREATEPVRRPPPLDAAVTSAIQARAVRGLRR